MGELTVAQEMLRDLQAELDCYLQNPDVRKNYCYLETYSEDYGNYDKNYTNRTRLAYALFYTQQDIPGRDSLIRELFLQEVISREHDDFQGIGVNLELLSILLRESESLDSELFRRAGNANFDCEMGYHPGGYRYPALAELELTDYIDMAGDMDLTAYACRLVDEFKQQIKTLTLEQLEKLKSFAKYATHRACDQESAVMGIYEYYFANHPESITEDRYRLQIAIEEYMEILIRRKDVPQVLQIFTKHADMYQDDPDSYCMLGADCILHLPACEETRIIWRRIHPLILEMLRGDGEIEIPLNGCIPFANCADCMGEPGLSRELRALDTERRKQLEQDSEERE